MSKRAKERKKKAAREGWRTAKDSDILELYELSVQDAESEVDIIDQVWTERRGRLASTLREDFCGSAIVCAEWVKRRDDNFAVGVDIDHEVLEWGRNRFPDKINEEQICRITLLEEDVLTVQTDPVDCLVASNFSYFIFKTRDALRNYFKVALQALEPDGLMLVDAYGGSEAFEEMEEDRDLDGFTYVWDQSHYNPITGDVINHIHFKFPDGTKIKKAFTYEWRLWTLPEIKETMMEAGFKNVVCYWEGTDEETEEGNGEWSCTEKGEACEGWIAYLVGEK